MTEIGTAERGKLGELYVIGELLRNGAAVFVPVVDTSGIDLIVRKNDGTLLEAQVKTTSAEVTAGWFDVYGVDHYQEDHFVIIGVDRYRDPPEFWIFPAKVFKEYSNRATLEDGSTLYRLGLDSKSRKHENQVRRDVLRSHLNDWKFFT